MKLTINTIKLQEMLTKAVKGASNNKLLPLTTLMAIKLENGLLSLTTTDGTNYLIIKENNIPGDYFYVVVQVDVFSKLISKLTCDTVTLELNNSYLNVVGNGTYKIDLVLDENGNMITYPNPVGDIVSRNVEAGNEPSGIIKTSVIKQILTSVKPALLTTMETPCYTCYYAGDSVIATDTYKISAIKEKLFATPKLISNELMNLLEVVTSDEISVYMEGNKLVFDSANCLVYGLESMGIENYSIDAITNLVNQPFTSCCKVPKEALVQLLDRISLFVCDYDKGEIALTFTSSGLMVSSKMSTGTELVAYTASENFKDFVCKIDVAMLMSQIKAQSTDIIEIWYGDNSALKITDGHVTSVVALLED